MCERSTAVYDASTAVSAVLLPITKLFDNIQYAGMNLCVIQPVDQLWTCCREECADQEISCAIDS